MCVFSQPKMPKVEPAETVVPPTTTEEDPAEQRRIELARQREAKRQAAKQDTIHTSVLGDTSQAMVRKKTLG